MSEASASIRDTIVQSQSAAQHAGRVKGQSDKRGESGCGLLEGADQAGHKSTLNNDEGNGTGSER